MPNNLTYTPENVILSYFETGDFPTQPQFAAAWTSYWHKGSLIPIASIDNLMQTLQGFASAQAFETHLQDTLAHAGTLTLLDASNLTLQNVNQWKSKLGVGSVPDNVGLVDVGLNQAVYNKEQIEAICLMIDDFVENGKIRADKIEALGLTELHEVTETSLTAFATNSANYTFEQNDIIAVPDGSGNFSLYIYKGGIKTVVGNYLPTGLTNITISMVEGLQTALNGKLDKPSGTGGFFPRQSGGVTTWVQISPASYYLTLWDGSDFKPSIFYQNGTKIGVGTQTPSEMLHLENGRIRTKAVVLDANSETLPNQITFDGSKFFGTNSTGVKRDFMFKDFADFRDLWFGLSDDEKNEIKTIANGGWSTNTMSIALINPVVVRDINAIQYVTLIGANLNLNPASFSVEIVDITGTNVIATIPNSQVQLQSTGTSMLFYFNFQNIPLGDYKIRLWNGVATYVSPVKFTVIDNVINIDLSAITWESKVYGDKTNPSIITSGSSISMTANLKNADGSEFDESGLIGQSVSAVLSSAIATMQDNFVIEFGVFNSEVSQERTYGGISLENNATLATSVLLGASLFYSSVGITQNLSNSQNISVQNTSATNRCIIYKNSNNITCVITNNGGTNIGIATVTVDSTPVKLKLLRQHFFAGEVNVTSNMQIITAYKF